MTKAGERLIEAAHEISAYADRAKAQMFAWAQGRSYHEPINDECAPDFSCCEPNLFEMDSAKRWEQYRKRYGDYS